MLPNGMGTTSWTPYSGRAAGRFRKNRWGHRLGSLITQANICALLLGKAQLGLQLQAAVRWD